MQASTRLASAIFLQRGLWIHEPNDLQLGATELTDGIEPSVSIRGRTRSKGRVLCSHEVRHFGLNRLFHSINYVPFATAMPGGFSGEIGEFGS